MASNSDADCLPDESEGIIASSSLDFLGAANAIKTPETLVEAFKISMFGDTEMSCLNPRVCMCETACGNECACNTRDRRIDSIININLVHLNRCKELPSFSDGSIRGDQIGIHARGLHSLNVETLDKICAERGLGCFSKNQGDSKLICKQNSVDIPHVFDTYKPVTEDDAKPDDSGKCPSYGINRGISWHSISNDFYEDSVSSPSGQIFSNQTEEQRSFSAGQGAPENEIWLKIIGKLEVFLDVYSLLMIRQTCRALYFYRYRLSDTGTLCFRGFVGYNSDTIFGSVLPLLDHILCLNDTSTISFDFSLCTLIKDISVVHMLTVGKTLQSRMEQRQYGRNIKELIFDFCRSLTDKGLEVMLATALPNLERLSLVCCRNEDMTGIPFIRGLSLKKWPNFTKFNCSFSNIRLDPIQAVADHVLHCSTFMRAIGAVQIPFPSTKIGPDGSFQGVKHNDCNRIGNGSVTAGNSLVSGATNSSCIKNYGQHEDDIFARKLRQFEICGSWGSRLFLDKLGFGAYVNAFATSLKIRSTNLCSRLTKRVQRGLEELATKLDTRSNSIIILLGNRGSELLVNCPITVEQREHGGIGVWTLPVSLAIQQDNIEMFNLLIRRGARVNVWDHLGKSPIYKACELGLERFVSKMLKLGRAPEPFDENGFSPLAVCVRNRNVGLVKTILKSGVDLNVSCPHIRNYKSPLYIACESRCEEIIKLLLENGADPNWRFHRKSTPTLLAYQLDKKWLPIFMHYGAAQSADKLWVLTEVLSCAILKEDLESIRLLIEKHPDLLDREHDVWSKPIIQASRLGKRNVLELLIENGADLNALDSYRTCSLQAAAEEGHIDCMKLLIEKGSNLNTQDIRGRDALHLACLENRAEAANLLLENKCDPNVKEFSNGETPLMTCLRTRNEAMALMLIKKAQGLNFDHCDKRGQNCLMYSFFFGQYKVGEVLMKRCREIKCAGNAEGIVNLQAIAKDRINSGSADKRLLKRFMKIYNSKFPGVVNNYVSSSPPTYSPAISTPKKSRANYFSIFSKSKN